MIRRLHADSFFTRQRDFYCLTSRLPMFSPSSSHCHEFYEVEIVTAGTAVDNINGVSYVLHRGDFIFLRPDDAHCIMSQDESGATITNIALSLSLMEEILSFLEESDVFSLSRPVQGHLPSDLISRLCAQSVQLTLPSQTPSRERSLVKQWVTACFLHRHPLCPPQGENRLPPWLQTLLQSLQTPDGMADGIDYIKTHTDLSYPHVCRCFQKYLHQTPVEWINEKRLLHSAHLLLHTHMSILDISIECGFNTLSHFNHLFRSFFGISPSSMRSLF